MAKNSTIRLRYRWAHGDSLDVIVQAPTSYPDALDQARSAAHREMTELLDQLLTAEAAPEVTE